MTSKLRIGLLVTAVCIAVIGLLTQSIARSLSLASQTQLSATHQLKARYLALSGLAVAQTLRFPLTDSVPPITVVPGETIHLYQLNADTLVLTGITPLASQTLTVTIIPSTQPVEWTDLRDD